jgi:hypothetical protein
MPSKGRCIAFNYNGSNFGRNDCRRLLYENGEEIPNVEEYFM